MNKRVSGYFAPSILASAIALSFSLPVYAQQQESAKDHNDIETIEVTARGRVETIQSVPDSVTAFSADDIESARITNIRDVANLTPNLTALDNFRPGLARINIRGLITPQVGDPPLAFVVDGVTASDIEFINQDLVDIERIEVMRGAQGALYGRGAVGGAILITTKQPYEDLEGTIKGSIGNGNTYELNGVLSGSLNEQDTAYFRIGGYSKSTDGLINNTFLDEEADYLDEESIFGQLHFELFDATTVSLKSRFTTSDAGFAYYQGVTENSVEDFSIETSQNIRNNDVRDVKEFSAKLSHDFTFATLDLISAYHSSENEHFYDGDYSADPTYEEDEFGFILRAPFGTEGLFDVESVTVEARLTSLTDGDLRWAVSSFYQDKERDNTINFFDDLLGDVPLARSDFSNDLIYLTIADINSSEAWAIAGQVNYDVTDKLELTGALRYDYDDRQSFDPNFKDETIANKDFSQWQPKATLAYQLNPDLLIYTGYSKGFRSGGFNEPAPGIDRVYDKETSDSYELGFKSTLFDGMATLNGALFAIDQTNAQITQFNVDTFTLENLAIDEVMTQGLELELALNLTDNLDLQLSGGWIDSEIKAFSRRPELEGRSQVWVSDFNYAMSLNHSIVISENWSLNSRADVQMLGPRYFDIEAPEIESSTNTFLNANIGLVSDQWAIQLYAKNLTDERTIEDNFFYGDGVTEFARLPNKPRSYGVEVTYSF
ncbi:TonB-dependent receptor [Thalassotalea litorea]|uniref:TonB-dependent receptor n=1 Tax=Thalassotalea litorea TaxID=2020715 RepID=A0A5R9IF72_9GAMM|nr:TonB-dependent receptor [Thalassotalea litorea]TLU64154.1 TonB-dependent receptor [Thalassotalea litorea]